MSREEGRRAVHAALPGLLDEGELVLRWCVTIDVAGPDGLRYLAHRSGGGADGTDVPMAWDAVGMLLASLDVCRKQLEDMTTDDDEEDDD